MRLLIASLIVLLTVRCAGPDGYGYLEDPSMQTVSATGDYPSVVKISLPEGKGLCTGTQIAPRAVLTAAHCTTSNGAYRVYFPGGSRLTYLKETLDSGQLGDQGDLAVLIFAQPFGEDYLPLGTTGVSYGDAIRLVGYGCDNLDTKLGTGVKRTGTNRVIRTGEFIEIATPLTGENKRRVLGPQNLAGSCFGDSGGPMLRFSGNHLRVVGVAHAGGWNDTQLISRYVDLSQARNKAFLHDLDSEYDLGLFNPCLHDPDSASCRATDAAVGITSLLTSLWDWFWRLW